MSYFDRHDKVFRRRRGKGDNVIRVRSEGRMKRYTSCNDLRAWSLDGQERRRHLLELVCKSVSGNACFGKYVPVPVLVDLLLANKNAKIDDDRQPLASNLLSKEQKWPAFGKDADLQNILISKDSEIDSLKYEVEAKMAELENRNIFLNEALEKLESLDKIMSENNDLQGKLAAAEEKNRILMEKKAQLEKEKELLSMKESKSELALREMHKYKEKAAEVEDLREEIERLKRRIAELEQMLDTDKPTDIKSEKDMLNSKLGILQAERDALLAEKKVLLKRCPADMVPVDHLNSELDGLKSELNGARGELERLKGAAGHLLNLESERDGLHKKLENYIGLETELECLRYRAKEADILRVERDRLKARVDELCKIELAYFEMAHRTRNFNVLLREHGMYKAKYEELQGLEDEVKLLNRQVEKLRKVASERDSYLKQKCEMECAMANQEEQIRRLNATLENVVIREDSTEMLSYSEVSFLHQQLCPTTGALIRKEKTVLDIQSNDLMAVVPLHKKIHCHQMERHISALENKITKKQLEATKRARKLELKVYQEKKRNQELDQCVKVQKCCQDDLKVEIDLLHRKATNNKNHIHQLIIMLEQERTIIRGLEDDLRKERKRVKILQSLLDDERKRAKVTKLKDSDVIEVESETNSKEVFIRQCGKSCWHNTNYY